MGPVWETQLWKASWKQEVKFKDLASINANRKPGCVSLCSWERRKDQGPVWDPRAVSVGFKVMFPPSDWGKKEASLWGQSNPSIEGNFQRKWFKLFGEKGLFQILFWSSYFHLKFTQIKIIMFSKGLVVLSGGGSLAWFSSMKLPGLWSFSLFEGKL